MAHWRILNKLWLYKLINMSYDLVFTIICQKKNHYNTAVGLTNYIIKKQWQPHYLLRSRHIHRVSKILFYNLLIPHPNRIKFLVAIGNKQYELSIGKWKWKLCLILYVYFEWVFIIVRSRFDVFTCYLSMFDITL